MASDIPNARETARVQLNGCLEACHQAMELYRAAGTAGVATSQGRALLDAGIAHGEASVAADPYYSVEVQRLIAEMKLLPEQCAGFCAEFPLRALKPNYRLYFLERNLSTVASTSRFWAECGLPQFSGYCRAKHLNTEKVLRWFGHECRHEGLVIVPLAVPESAEASKFLRLLLHGSGSTKCQCPLPPVSEWDDLWRKLERACTLFPDLQQAISEHYRHLNQPPWFADP